MLRGLSALSHVADPTDADLTANVHISIPQEAQYMGDSCLKHNYIRQCAYCTTAGSCIHASSWIQASSQRDVTCTNRSQVPHTSRGLLSMLYSNPNLITWERNVTVLLEQSLEQPFRTVFCSAPSILFYTVCSPIRNKPRIQSSYWLYLRMQSSSQVDQVCAWKCTINSAL